MRVPGRLHITWDNDTTMKVETEAGTQTRLFHFGSDAAGAARARPCPGCTRIDLDRVRVYVSDKPGCLRHVTLACYVPGQLGPAKETGTSVT